MRLNTCTALGIWLCLALPIPAASCEVPSDEQLGVVQFLPEYMGLDGIPSHAGLLAWRQWEDANGRLCIALDFPITKRLSDEQVQVLHGAMAKHHRQTASTLEPARIVVATRHARQSLPLYDFPPVRSAAGLPTVSSHCAIAKQVAQQKFWRFADTDQGFTARLTATSCAKNAQYAGSGTAFLVAPSLAITAAHIVTDKDANIPCQYRVVPGGGSYNHGRAQPFGSINVSKIALSARARSWMAKSVNDLSQTDLRRYVASDYAFLALAPNSLATSNLHWPAIVFGEKVRGKPVYKSGYPVESYARALRPPGASLSADGQDACAPFEDLNTYSVLSFYGDSGGPIWQHPAQQAFGWLSIISLVSVIQRDHESAAYTYSPRFSLALYGQFVSYLRAH